MALGNSHHNHIICSNSYTKMGYAGNMEPSYLIPTVIAESINKVNLILQKIEKPFILNLFKDLWHLKYFNKLYLLV